MKSIKLFVMDVDGTLTDGKIYTSASGELFKAFDVKDGYGIRHILKQNEIKSAIITGRESDIVRLRAVELEVDFLYQGISDKRKCLEGLLKELNYNWSQVCYIGDDVNDLECLQMAGVSGCPCDALEEVKKTVDYVAKVRAGNGAVREMIDWIVEDSEI